MIMLPKSGALLSANRAKGIGFFRLLGYGLHWQDTRQHRKLWSDRNQVFHQVEIGPWLITPLPRGGRGFRR